MKLKTLIGKSFLEMTPEERRGLVHAIRFRRHVEQPAVVAREKEVKRKASQSATASAEKLLKGLSKAEIAKLLQQELQ